jgi:predicted SAM-dependent methyltransferase
MGWADWLLMATGFGYQCYGMELSESRIKYAQSRGIKVLNWEDAEQMSFDFINTEQVFEHIPNPLETLKKLKTLLKPGGIIKISVPTTNDIDRRLKFMDWGSKKGMRNSLNAISPLEHIQYYKRSSLDKMAEMAEMTEVTISLICQYNNSFGWFNHKDLVRNALLPIYRNLLRKQNYVFLSPKLDQGS